MQEFDTVVIGSGIGGLTSALCHARAGERVLIVEQHTVPGGWCHSFAVDRYRFSTGVHYIGELWEGGRLRQLFEGLGLGGDLQFCELNSNSYEHVFIGGDEYHLPVGRDAMKSCLTRYFPHEQRGVEKLLATMGRMSDDMGRILDMERLVELLKVPFVAPTLARWSLVNHDRFLRSFVKDEKLIGLLSAQAVDHGMPPNKIMSIIPVSIMEHYMGGAYYPLNGGLRLPKAFLRAIRKYNGTLLLGTRVDEIATRGSGRSRRVAGVRLSSGEQVICKKVISNADPHQTFTRLVDVGSLRSRLRRRLEKTHYSVSCLGLFMVADIDLKARGFDSGNYMYYPDYDINKTFESCRNGNFLDGEDLPFYFLTITSLKDPSKATDRYHTLEAFTFLPFEAFEKWERTRTGDRPDDYRKFKEKLMNRFLDHIEKLIPDIRKSLKHCDMGTPLTNSFYTNSTRGSIYGTEKSFFQTGPFSFLPTTEIQNLYLCGASTLAHGVYGAMLTGLLASRISLGCGNADLLAFMDRSITVYQSEEINSWPERYHERIRRSWRHPEVVQEG